jgi:rhodanese-related sulfurtransferase
LRALVHEKRALNFRYLPIWHLGSRRAIYVTFPMLNPKGKPLMKTLLLATLAFACWGQSAAPAPSNTGYRALVEEAKAHVKQVDLQKFRELRQARAELVLIDVRETEEWVKGHAAGALHISKGMLEHDIEAAVPQKDKFIVLYCHSGARSALAAENLDRMGYSNVYSLDGGLTAYEAAGLAIEK